MAIYLDCAATTPIDPRVEEEVRRYLAVDFGNAGSRTHDFGLRARRAVERARDQVAAVAAAARGEVVFTSGATESNNLAILGLEEYGRRTRRTHLLSSEIEHHAVLEPLQALAGRGFTVTYLPRGLPGPRGEERSLLHGLWHRGAPGPPGRASGPKDQSLPLVLRRRPVPRPGPPGLPGPLLGGPARRDA